MRIVTVYSPRCSFKYLVRKLTSFTDSSYAPKKWLLKELFHDDIASIVVGVGLLGDRSKAMFPI